MLQGFDSLVVIAYFRLAVNFLLASDQFSTIIRMPDVLVEAAGLVKHYPPRDRHGSAFTAVDGIDFTLRRGEAFGFLGPNGAGKSSTMRMIALRVAGHRRARCGSSAWTRARQGRQIRGRLGVVPQDDALDRELTVRENLLIYGRYFGLPKPIIAAAQRPAAGVRRSWRTKAGERVDALSGGMRRRLTIARSLINEPEILLLDEPTTGLDPQARHVLWDRLFRLKQQGVTLMLTTHYMDEAEQLCDRLVVMDKGRIVAEGSPAELIAAHSTREVLELRFGIGEQDTARGEAARRRRSATGSRNCPTGCSGTPTTARRRWPRAPRSADPGHRAGAALHAGGRVPAR